MAELANQRGTAFYKNGDLTKAQEEYQAAVNLDSKVAKYPSNLSAAQYEAGHYSECICSIRKSWTLLSHEDATDALAIKLATRFAKARINAVTPVPPSEVDGAIEEFTMHVHASGDPKFQEMRSSWDQWRAIRDSDQPKEPYEAARRCLLSIPIFKSRMDPTLEYFTFGHDDVQSLLDGVNEKGANRKSWAFLFGGSGDARHVLGTIIHIGHLSVKRKVKKRAHMTLVDVHPASFARFIIVLSLVHQISLARLEGDENRRIELHTTLFYLYGSMVMPDYCHKIVVQTAGAVADDLLQKGGSGLLECLCIDDSTLRAITDVLKYWSKPLPKSTKVLLDNRPVNRDVDMDDMMSSFMGLNIDIPTAGLRKLSMQNRQAGGDIYGDPLAERAIFQRTMAMIPPKTLLSRHPALAKLVRSYMSASDVMYSAVYKEVARTWKPNPTIFHKRSTEHRDLGDVLGYPAIDGDSYWSIKPFIDVIMKFQKKQSPLFCQGNTAFPVTAQFFELVADSLLVLEKTLKLELLVSDVFTGIPKLISGEFGDRPKDFPVRYSRVWLSNVPDYTHGILTTAVHLLTYLEPQGLIMSNCLLNTGVWGNVRDYCYNYTLLLPKDLPRFLGCQLANPKALCWEDINLQQINMPLPLEKLASKNELYAWLAHLLVCTLCSTISQPTPNKVEMPNNLAAFLHVLIHLHRVGFPSHWLGDFLGSVLANNLITAAVPYTGKLPIPVSESGKKRPARKINLSPWLAELEVIITKAKDALPFPVAIPDSYCNSVNEIHTYSATVVPINLDFDSRIFIWGSGLTSLFISAIGIIFCKDSTRVANILESLSGIIEGKSVASSGDLQIMLSTEGVDLSRGSVSWKMSKHWYEKMRREKWSMAVYRTDLKALVSLPLNADRWVQQGP